MTLSSLQGLTRCQQTPTWRHVTDRVLCVCAKSSDCSWLSVLVLGELQGQVSCKVPPTADDAFLEESTDCFCTWFGWLKIPCRIDWATTVSSACNCRTMQYCIMLCRMLSRIIDWVVSGMQNCFRLLRPVHTR